MIISNLLNIAPLHKGWLVESYMYLTTVFSVLQTGNLQNKVMNTLTNAYSPHCPEKWHTKTFFKSFKETWASPPPHPQIKKGGGGGDGGKSNVK